ncbi:hypothetical protein B0I37DRAFT_422952 [Chaetomium sp. MPI-CAGE-AT-0009]|nr:hypothetical protein B0I37DRAFT_422952 [Chaetomium sp. MPI-CAGE-AT-0009]
MSAPKASWEGGPEEFKMLQAAISEAYLVLHGPPDLPHNAEILGVCGISTENADQNKYGWMVADFLHWKLLLHGLDEKTAQTWDSSLNISKFLENIDGVDMANDDTVHDIIGRHEVDIIPMPRNNEDFEAAFLWRLSESAHAAVSRGTVLAVMVFAPVTPEQDICVDLGGKPIYLTTDRLYRTINEAVSGVQFPIMILTPSPFTGGWSCRSINPPMCPSSDQMLRIIAKSSGGAFANRFMRSFTERNSPLITDSEREGITYDDPMPLRPTTLQTDSLRHFQRQIHESLEHRFSVFAKDHAFILRSVSARDLSVFSDTWAEYGPRIGLRFEHWAERWGSTRPYINHPRRFEFLGEAFGGTRESQLFHLNHLIETELATNMGDWGRQVGGCTHELYVSFKQSLMPTEDEAKRVFDALEFRASSATVAQMVVKAFDLPLPDGSKCRYWHDKMDGVNDDHYRKLQYAFGQAHCLFDQAAVLPSENKHEFKNVRFLRAARWLSAAIASRFVNGSREEIEAFVHRDVARFITKIQDAQKALLLEDQAVTRAGLGWVAALGLGGQPPAAASVDNLARYVAQGPDDAGLTEQTSAGSQQHVQAAPWAPNLAEQTQHQETAVAASAEAENSIAQSDTDQATENAPDYPDTQTAKNDWVDEAWSLVDTSDWRINDTNGEFDSPVASNVLHTQEEPDNNTAAWETATSVPTTSFLGVDDNADAWDKILNPPVASNSGQEKRQARISFQDSEDLLDLEDESLDEPTTPIPPEPVAKSSLQQALGRLAQSLAEVGIDMGTSGWDEAEYLTRVFKKVAENIEQDKAAMALGSKAWPPAGERTSSSNQAGFSATKDHSTRPKWLDAPSWRSPRPTDNGSEGVRTPSEGYVATPWRLGQGGTGQGKSKATPRISNEETAATSSGFFDVSPEVTGGHSRMGSFSIQMQSPARHNPVHTHTPAMQHAAGMRASQASTDNMESAQPATSRPATTDNQLDDQSEDASNLACGNAFWARTGFKF